MALQEKEIEVRGKKYRFVLTPAGKALLAHVLRGNYRTSQVIRYSGKYYTDD